MPPPPQRGPPTIDRQQVTPSLVRLFYKSNSFPRPDDFLNPTSLPPHLEMYTWPDCTLRELTQILTTQLAALKNANPDADIPQSFVQNPTGSRLAFRLIFPDVSTSGFQGRAPRYNSTELGSVIVGTKGDGGDGWGHGHDRQDMESDGTKTLRDARFVIGDYVACAICPPNRDGSAAPIPGAPNSSGRMHGGSYGVRGAYGIGPSSRENGYGGGYGPRNGGRGGFRSDAMMGRNGYGGPPLEEWRRGERLPSGPAVGGYSRNRGRGRGW